MTKCFLTFILNQFNKKVNKELDIIDILDFKFYAIKGKIFVIGILEEKEFESEKEAKIYITNILELEG